MDPRVNPSLGWGILRWSAKYLPIRLTDEQARLVVDWYSIDRHTTRFIYRRAILEMAKGWGKSPLAAVIALAEFCGPVCFAGWDAKGEPIGEPWGTNGRPPAWVQIAACSEDQTDNTYGAIYDLLSADDHKVAKALGIDDGRTVLHLKARPSCTLEPVTASAGSREGQRITFAILDETHLWKPDNGGVKLAATLRRNATKMNSRTFETTNAPTLGERSVAEKSGVDAEAGKPGIYYFCKRASEDPDPKWPKERLLAELDHLYGDAYWVDRQRVLADLDDMAWEDALRFFFNRRVAGAGKAVDPRKWDALADPQREVPAGTYIGLGFDGSISRDATVLRGCTQDGHRFTIGSWERPKGAVEWMVDRKDVKEKIDWAFAYYNVGRMFCDPPKWQTEIDDWAEEYGEEVVLLFDTNQPRKFAPAVDRWLTTIRLGTGSHDADPLADRHVKSAHLRKAGVRADEDDERTLYVLVKGDSGMRIDGAVADVLAHEAAMTMPEQEPELEPLVAWG